MVNYIANMKCKGLKVRYKKNPLYHKIFALTIYFQKTAQLWYIYLGDWLNKRTVVNAEINSKLQQSGSNVHR